MQRWLVVPLQIDDGTLIERVKGTPQGGVVSPLLSNLFLHYVFDKWMERNFPEMKWCRYCDDALVHCKTYEQAEELKAKLDARFKECGLELHPLKTKIIYCKDADRKANYTETKFDFLGFTFRPRGSKNKYTGKLFTNFLPAISKNALNSIRRTIWSWRIGRRADKSIEDLAKMFNPIIRGWNNYYGRFYPSALRVIYRYINVRLSRWVGNKYINLRGHKIKCVKWVESVAKQRPKLFAHWNGKVLTIG